MHDIYTEITDRIIAALEAGTPPWVRPWGGEADPTPMNAETRRPYRGVNFLTLSIEAQAHAYHRNRWLTYRQAAALSAHVRKGEHGTPVVFWKLREVEAGPDEDKQRVVPLLRCYTVFNTAQIDGLPAALAEPLPSVPKWPSDEVAEALIEGPVRTSGTAASGLTTSPATITSRCCPAQASPARRATTLRRCTNWCTGRHTRRAGSAA